MGAVGAAAEQDRAASRALEHFDFRSPLATITADTLVISWAGEVDRILGLGAGPAQLAMLVAPHVAEVVAVEPEPDMLAEGERRARAHGAYQARAALVTDQAARRVLPWTRPPGG